MSSGASQVRTEAVQIARNSFVLGIGQALTMVLGFVTTILVTDHLGTSYGLLIGAQRFVGLFLVLAQFGLTTYVVRTIAARDDSVGSVLGNTLLLRAGLAAAFGILVVGSSFAFDYLPESRWLLLAFVVIESVGVLADLFTSVCQGRELMGRVALIGLIRSVANCTGIVVVVATDGGLAGVMAVYIATRVIELVAAVTITATGVDTRPITIRWSRLGSILRQASLYLMVGIGYMAFRSLDVIMLSKLSVVREVARYGAALNFIDTLLLVPLLVQRALLPAFSRLLQDRTGAVMGTRSLQVFSVILFPAVVGLGLLAPQAVALYPSGEFADAASVLAMLAPAFFFLAIASICSTLLTGSGRLREIIVGYVVAIALQVTVNALLIPTHGALGAAWGTMGATVVLACWLLLRISRIDVTVPLGSMLQHAVAAAGMGAVVYLTREMALPVPVLAGAVVYFGMLFLIVGANSLERKILAELLAKLARSRRSSRGT